MKQTDSANAGWLRRLVRRLVNRLITLVTSDDDLIVGQHIQREYSRPTLAWVRSRYGVNQVDEVAALASKSDNPSAIGFLPAETLDQLQLNHALQKATLLVWNLVKYFIKRIWHNGAKSPNDQAHPTAAGGTGGAQKKA